MFLKMKKKDFFFNKLDLVFLIKNLNQSNIYLLNYSYPFKNGNCVFIKTYLSKIFRNFKFKGSPISIKFFLSIEKLTDFLQIKSEFVFLKIKNIFFKSIQYYFIFLNYNKFILKINFIIKTPFYVLFGI